MPGYDLHSHTVLSDGTTTPEENVAAAIALGLEGLGVTDHDTTAPFGRATAAAEGSDLEIVLGTEFSAELGGASVHVLGYWIDPSNVPLQAEMDRVRDERTRRAGQIVEKFRGLGIEITLERVRELAGEAPIGRPHIARAVIEAGHATTTTEVFERWLADGGPANVVKHAVDPATAVRLLVAAGGVAVLAHPGLYGPDDVGISAEVIEELVGAGLAGIEADHPNHDAEDRRTYGDIADALGLVKTAGSDFHGERKTLKLGEATTSRAALETLRERLPSRSAHGV